MKTNTVAEKTPGQPSITELVRGIFQDLQTLASKELLSVKLEIKEEINKALGSAISFGAGGFFLAVAAVLLSFMVVFLLNTYTGLPLWASFGLVGLAYAIVGGLLLWRGKHKAAQIDPYPERSVQNLKEDIQEIQEAVTR